MKQKLKRWIATFLVTLTVISGIATAGAPLIHAELTENGQHQLLCDTDSNQNQTGNSNNSDGTGPNSGGTSGRWKHPPTYYNIPDLGDGKIQANDIASGRAVCSRIAKAVGKATGIDPAILMGQMWAETSWGTAPAALSARNGDHCITGIGVVAGTPGVSTGAGHAEGDGAYGHYDSWQHFAMAWACILDTDVSEKGHHDPATFVRDLKAHKYFTDSNVAGYIARVEAGMQKYKNGDGAGDGAILNGAGSAADSGAAGANDNSSAGTDCVCTQNNNSNNTEANATVSGGGSNVAGMACDQGNAKQLFDFLTKKMGFSGAGAAAAVGNAIVESGVNPKASNGSHFGIFQWSSDRMHSPLSAGDQGTWTMDNELKNTQTELNGAYKQVKQTVGNASDVSSAATYWQDNYEVAKGQGDNQRVSCAQAIYKQFNAGSIKANASLLGASNAASDGTNTQNSGSQDETCTEADSSSSSNLLNIAKKLLGYFTYSMGNRRDVAKNGDLNSLKSVADVKKDGQTDCSGFVWLCSKLGGYNVPANMGWFTVPMQSDARGPHKWLKEVPESQAKAGDIVICGSGAGAGGHTAILAENWHGDDTKIIQEGGQGGGGGVNEGTFGLSFGSMGNNNRVFAEPVK